MKPRAQQIARSSLGTARHSFERWRRSRARGTRIPETLWKGAVELARQHGVWRTARMLRLDYYSLKTRVAAAVSRNGTAAVGAGQGGGFVEIPLRALAAGPDCFLELEDGQGGCLRLGLTRPAVSDLASLARALWTALR